MKIVMTVELGKPNKSAFQNMVIRMVADLCTMLNHTQTVGYPQYKIADAEYEVVQ